MPAPTRANEVPSVLILEYSAPRVDSASPEITGKFLQLAWRRHEYLVFAPFALHRYHNQILAHFAEDHDISYDWVSREKLEVKDQELAVRGGGRFRVNRSQKILELWDDSEIYGRFDELGLAEKIASADHPWSGFALRIS
jgi:hypothetical protein